LVAQQLFGVGDTQPEGAGELNVDVLPPLWSMVYLNPFIAFLPAAVIM
jgi:hypothetical protein